MSKIEVKHPIKTADTGAYSTGIISNGFLFVSGQGPLDLITGAVVEGSIEEQTLLTLSHIKMIVETTGATLQDIVKCTVHLKDIEDFDRFNAIYANFFSGILPARTTVQSVLWGGIKIEIDAIAAMPGK